MSDRAPKEISFTIKKTDLKYGNKPVVQASVPAGKYSRSDIKKAAKALGADLVENGASGSMFVSLMYPDLWRPGYNSVLGGDVDLFTMEDYDGDATDPEHYRNFRIYILQGDLPRNQRKRRGKINIHFKGGSDPFDNDCLYDCLFSMIGCFKKEFKTPKQFKQYLGLRRRDMVPIECFEKIEELFPDYKFHIRGDTVYRTKGTKKYDVYLTLIREHFEIDDDNGWQVHGISYAAKQFMIYSDVEEDDTFPVYDGKNYKHITRDAWDYIRKHVVYSDEPQPYILIKHKNNKKKGINNMKDTFDYMTKCAKELKEASFGIIDMYKTGSFKKTALKLFKDLALTIQPRALEPDEQEWVYRTMMGATRFNDNYEGPAYKYDINGMYSALQASQQFGVPIKRGEFKEMTNEEFQKLKFFEYGFYRVKISGNIDHKQFVVNSYNYYTHYDLTTAKELGYEMELIEDGEDNCLLYNGEKRVSGATVFGPFVKMMFDLCQKGIAGAKEIRNVLWGALMEKREYIMTFTKEDTIEEENEITSLCPVGENGIRVNFRKKSLTYKTNFARFGPFLTARGRRMITKVMQPHLEHIKRVHTDGFISDVPLTFEKSSRSVDSVSIGSEIGNLKFEGFCDNVTINRGLVTGQFRI